MQTQRRFWEYFQQYRVVNLVVSSCIVVALVLYFVDVIPRVKVGDAHTQHVGLSTCAHPISLESVASKQLSALAVPQNANRPGEILLRGSYRVGQSDADLNLPYTNSQRCTPGRILHSDHNVDIAHKMSIVANAPVVATAPDRPDSSVGQAVSAIHFVQVTLTTPLKPSAPTSPGFLAGVERSMPLSASMSQGSASNVFPYGQCTWWANQRYHQLTGSFVPWSTNANAYQWVDRAIDYGWHVSGTPIVGSIMVLQPYVQGAYGFGHVGVVEQILTSGNVVASSMNWGSYPSMVTDTTFVPRPGVSFIYPTNM